MGTKVIHSIRVHGCIFLTLLLTLTLCVSSSSSVARQARAREAVRDREHVVHLEEVEDEVDDGPYNHRDFPGEEEIGRDVVINPERLEFQSHRRSKHKSHKSKEKVKSKERRDRHEKEAEPQRRAEPDRDPDKYLEKFGYLPEAKTGVQHSPEAREEAIRNFQRMAGMTASGRLDRKTIEKMASPRCGMPDMIPVGQEITANDRARTPSGLIAAKVASRSNVEDSCITAIIGHVDGYYVPGYKWTKTDLTWRTDNYSPDLASSSQRRAFSKAFKHWSDVTPLTFRESTRQDVDIEIKFAHHDHGDGYGNRFDGEGGTLAHAFYPENGDTHFDESERWTENTDQGTNLEIVAAHEFGHALGLGHSNDQSALMAPFYQGYIPNFSLPTDDIRGIQNLYGSNMRPQNTPRPPTRTTPRPTNRPGTKPGSSKPSLCTGRFDDVMQDQTGAIYGFSGKWMWKMNYWSVEPDWPRQARKVYRNTPPYSPRAAVYSWRTRYTYFFKKNRVHQFYGLRRLRKKTIKTAGYPLPQAAFMASDGKIYILAGDYYWVFDENRLDVSPGSRGRISSKWPGVPGGITGAVRLSDGFTYFFKGTKYRKYDERLRRVVTGYPRDTAAPWMGPKCSPDNRYQPK